VAWCKSAFYWMPSSYVTDITIDIMLPIHNTHLIRQHLEFFRRNMLITVFVQGHKHLQRNTLNSLVNQLSSISSHNDNNVWSISLSDTALLVRHCCTDLMQWLSVVLNIQWWFSLYVKVLDTTHAYSYTAYTSPHTPQYSIYFREKFAQ